jgi:agmatinase
VFAGSVAVPDRGFLGAPITEKPDGADFVFMGAPHGVAYTLDDIQSTARAPATVREVALGYFERLRLTPSLAGIDFDTAAPHVTAEGLNLIDMGDVPSDPRSVHDAPSRVTETVRSIVTAGAVPIIVGGDDSIPPLIVRAFEGYGPINVLQIDAHLDFIDDVDGLRDGYSSPMRRISEMSWVDRVVQVGMRGAGRSRQVDLDEARVKGTIVTAQELHAGTPNLVADHIRPGERWYVTVDVDGLDPSIAPGCTPLPGGVSFYQAVAMLRTVATRGHLVGCSFVEYHPAIDVNRLTAITITRLICILLAHASEPG